jgi:hypothetical protein
VEVLFTKGSNGSLEYVRGQIQQLNRLFALARLYNTGQRGRLIEPVYITHRPAYDVTDYRSELLDGAVVLDDRALGGQWRAAKVKAQITWTRRYYWEGPDTALLVSGKSGFDLGSTEVFNSYQPPTYLNYATISGSGVEGDLPSPLKIRIDNGYNSTDRLGQVWMGAQTWSGVLVGDHNFEGENGTGGTTTANGSASGGYYRSCSWSGTGAVNILTWSLDSAMVTRWDGAWARAILRIQTTPSYSDLRVWLQVGKTSLAGATALLQTAPVLVGNAVAGVPEYVDLGLVRVPPFLGSGAGAAYCPIDIALMAQRDTTGTHSLDIDTLYLLPVDGGWRHYTYNGYALPYPYQLWDDGTTGQLYVTDGASANRSGHYIAFGAPLMLFPYKSTTLYFLMDTWTGGIGLTRALRVFCSYRPRRLTV